MNFKINIEYPEVKIETENKEYAKMLLNIYAGRYSEETSINLLSYESIKFNEYSDIFYEIKDVENIHINILGTLIKLLGMEPILIFPNNIDNGYKYWNSSFISYNNDLKKSLIFNITQKQKIIDDYKNCIEVIDDIYIKHILNRIILDEELHIKIFNNLINEF